MYALGVLGMLMSLAILFISKCSVLSSETPCFVGRSTMRTGILLLLRSQMPVFYVIQPSNVFGLQITDYHKFHNPLTFFPYAAYLFAAVKCTHLTVMPPYIEVVVMIK
jgi:hypothetical protein